MKKNLIICGEPGTDKSVLAKWIASTHIPENVIIINGRSRSVTSELSSAFGEKKTATLVIIEDLPTKKIDIGLILLVSSDVCVNVRGESPTSIPWWQFRVIVVTDKALPNFLILGQSFTRRFDIVEVNPCSYNKLS